MKYFIKIFTITALLATYLIINGYGDISDTFVCPADGLYPDPEYQIPNEESPNFISCEQAVPYKHKCSPGLVFKASIKACGVEGSVEIPLSGETGHWVDFYSPGDESYHPSSQMCAYSWLWSHCLVGNTRPL